MKKISLSELKDDLSRDDWFEYRLTHDTHFLKRIDKARSDIRTGKGIKLEDFAK
jgi:hypothetical protein